ncbi:MAG TPA: ATP-binding cassette domain-containing protein, partial [Kofleriaceae bacterium]
MALLQTRGLTRRFGGLTALDRVDLALGAGEILGVIGPNGAGKTTLFSLIAGSLRPSAGEILLDGRPVTRLAAHRRVRAGIVRTHQIVRPFANLTVFENVLVAAMHAHGGAAGHARDRAADVLELVGLADRYDQSPGSLTLAGRTRLELARALSTGPRVLLLDEVAGGLVEHETAALVELVKQVRASGVSIVWIEHIVHALIAAVDRL